MVVSLSLMGVKSGARRICVTEGKGKFFNLNYIYNALNNNTINKHCQNIAKACTLICTYVCAVVSGVKHVSSFVSFNVHCTYIHI